MNVFVRSLLTVAVVFCCLSPASADRPSAWYAKACGLTGTPSSVTVDVYADASPGSVADTVLNAEVSRYGSTDCYTVNLSTTIASISFPATTAAADTSYTLIWTDDASNEVVTSETVIGYPGAARFDSSCEQEEVIYPTVTVPSRGITATVINAGRPSYIKVEVSCTQNFGTPDFTYYKVFYYDASGRTERRDPSLTPPSP